MNERKTVNGQSVGLGCGTLVIIALLMYFFNQGSVSPLRKQIETLETKVDTLQVEIESANSKLDTLLAAPAPAGSGGD